jgi:hypothetical protein
VHTVKENAEALIVASKKTGLEVNADKTKYKILSRDNNAGRLLRLNTDNISFESLQNSHIWLQP